MEAKDKKLKKEDVILKIKIKKIIEDKNQKEEYNDNTDNNNNNNNNTDNDNTDNNK